MMTMNLLRRHRLRWRLVNRKRWARYCVLYSCRPPARDTVLCEGFERIYCPCPDLEECKEVARR